VITPIDGEVDVCSLGSGQPDGSQRRRVGQTDQPDALHKSRRPDAIGSVRLTVEREKSYRLETQGGQHRLPARQTRQDRSSR